MKNNVAVAALLFLLILFSGCYWERKEAYYPPRTAVNTIGVRKVPLAECPVTDSTMLFSFENEIWQDSFRKSELGRKLLDSRNVGYFIAISYLDRPYYIFAWNVWPYVSPCLKIVSALDTKKVVAEFAPPRHIDQIAAFQQRLKGKDYLVVYVGQSDMSNSSTLLIFDENFRIVYQDHLLGALEIGHDADKIVVKSENFWYPKDDKRVDINGDWVYFIP